MSAPRSEEPSRVWWGLAISLQPCGLTDEDLAIERKLRIPPMLADEYTDRDVMRQLVRARTEPALMPTVQEKRELIAELMAYGESVLEAHSDLCKSDIEEQLDAHFESRYPEVNDTLIADVVEQIMSENFDPTPYCYGGHRGPLDCDCGPYAE